MTSKDTLPLKFKPITIDDCETIQLFTYGYGCRVSDFSFANLYGWQFHFGTEYAVLDDWLVLRYTFGGETWYMMPLPPCDDCDDDCDDDAATAVIEQLRRNAFLSGHAFRLYGLERECAEWLQSLFPDMRLTECRNQAGYLYRRESLAGLAGRRLQQKRNHVNKFRSLYPDAEYRPLTADLVPECLAFATRWKERHLEHFPEQTESAESEMQGIRRNLGHWDQLPLIGGTLWVDGRMVAFTYGCPVSGDTFDVCVEKADTAYEGSYTVINQLFAQHLPEQYTFMNREEDLGVEGLRHAKLSYQPEEILVRWQVEEALPRPRFERLQARNLWQDTFHDEESFADLYFSSVFTPERNIYCLDDDRMVAALQLLPHKLLWDGREMESVYVSGVAVDDAYRRRGIGGQLMRQAHAEAYQRGAVFALLVPAEDWIRDWYHSMGYAERAQCVPSPEGVASMPFEEFDRWQRGQACPLLLTAEDYDIALTDLRLHTSEPPTLPYPAMLRIINVREALQQYASAHPEVRRTIVVVGDSHIPDNNACYTIGDGKIDIAYHAPAEAEEMNVAQLADLLFADVRPQMCLMMDR